MAAWAYVNIDPSQYDWVFLLGVAHKTHLNKAALSTASSWKTPLGSLEIDEEIV